MIKKSHKPIGQTLVLVTFQTVHDLIYSINHTNLMLLRNMVNPSDMNQLSLSALVCLYAGLVREVPGAILDQDQLDWSLMKMFLADSQKFVDNLKSYKDFILKNQLTQKNLERANYWLAKYHEKQSDNNQSLSYQFATIAQHIIKLDKARNSKLPHSPARSLSASPSPKDQPDLFGQDEIVQAPQRKSYQPNFNGAHVLQKPHHVQSQSMAQTQPLKQHKPVQTKK